MFITKFWNNAHFTGEILDHSFVKLEIVIHLTGILMFFHTCRVTFSGTYYSEKIAKYSIEMFTWSKPIVDNEANNVELPWHI